MAVPDLRDLLQRAQSWPDEAQKELIAVANEIESELRGGEYLASQEELKIIDAAMAAIDRGEVATESEIDAAFAKFRRG
ncbi:hypothetical protein QWJ07_18450 [Frankia sp. RB7]|nr:hypothetical protein [Frankia sp. RB7]